MKTPFWLCLGGGCTAGLVALALLPSPSGLSWALGRSREPSGTAAVADKASGDWPQFRGPGRDDRSSETGLLKDWPKEGPPLQWTFSDAGVGYSGPAIVKGRLYTMGGRGDTEYVFAIDVKTGKEIWSSKIAPLFDFKGNAWGPGPRATPTVDGDLVFALGGQGELVCVAADSGKERWRVSMTKDLQGEISHQGGGNWGYTWSPLVDGEQVVCVPGGTQGTLAALDRKSGKVLWRSVELTEPATYASPVAADIEGVRQYVQMTDHGVASVAAKDGRLVWNYLRKPPYPDVVIPTPIVHKNEVYATAGWGAGCDLVKITPAGEQFKAAKIYANKTMKNALGGVVLVEGNVYGYSERRGWVCQDLQKGKALWENKALGSGSLTYADGRLYCFTDDEGLAALVEASAEGWKEHGKFEIPQKSKVRATNGKIWTHPVVAEGRLFLRDQDLIFCYDVTAH